MICGAVVALICYFFWMFFTPQLPVLLMGWLMKFPPVFAFLSDKMLRLLMFGVTVVSVYVWSVMMMAWGMFPFWSVLIIIFGWYAFTLAACPPTSAVPNAIIYTVSSLTMRISSIQRYRKARILCVASSWANAPKAGGPGLK